MFHTLLNKAKGKNVIWLSYIWRWLASIKPLREIARGFCSCSSIPPLYLLFLFSPIHNWLKIILRKHYNFQNVVFKRCFAIFALLRMFDENFVIFLVQILPISDWLKGCGFNSNWYTKISIQLMSQLSFGVHKNKKRTQKIFLQFISNPIVSLRSFAVEICTPLTPLLNSSARWYSSVQSTVFFKVSLVCMYHVFF